MANVMKKAAAVDSLGLRLRSILVNQDERSVLISDLLHSQQTADIHSVNCGGYGRLWHKSSMAEESWEKFCLPYQPASWKLGVTDDKVSTVQVFQLAGCNYRCWFCYVDYALLRGDIKRAKYFTCESLVESYARETCEPKVIRLSGGQPDLVPEWVPWMMTALKGSGLDRDTYLWVDDNLSNDYAWRFLQDEDWDVILDYRNFGRVGCLKGFDRESFHFNTGAPPEHFDRQLRVLSRLVKTGLDVYVYLVLTSRGLDKVKVKMDRLLDSLQAIHPNLPLRVCPIKIIPFMPTLSRMHSAERGAAEQNQYRTLEVWREALAGRFPAAQLSQPCYLIDIGQAQSLARKVPVTGLSQVCPRCTSMLEEANMLGLTGYRLEAENPTFLI